jgi:hypothetical protein
MTWPRIGRPLPRSEAAYAPPDNMAVPISGIRDLGRLGRSCEIRTRLTLNNRAASMIVVWHYDDEDAAPRLVTVYPTT